MFLLKPTPAFCKKFSFPHFRQKKDYCTFTITKFHTCINMRNKTNFSNSFPRKPKYLMQNELILPLGIGLGSSYWISLSIAAWFNKPSNKVKPSGPRTSCAGCNPNCSNKLRLPGVTQALANLSGVIFPTGGVLVPSFSAVTSDDATLLTGCTPVPVFPGVTNNEHKLLAGVKVEPVFPGVMSNELILLAGVIVLPGCELINEHILLTGGTGPFPGVTTQLTGGTFSGTDSLGFSSPISQSPPGFTFVVPLVVYITEDCSQDVYCGNTLNHDPDSTAAR